jgi:hypothetical protein
LLDSFFILVRLASFFDPVKPSGLLFPSRYSINCAAVTDAVSHVWIAFVAHHILYGGVVLDNLCEIRHLVFVSLELIQQLLNCHDGKDVSGVDMDQVGHRLCRPVHGEIFAIEIVLPGVGEHWEVGVR